MNLHGDNGSCALNHLDGLYTFEGKPEAAMRTFCAGLVKTGHSTLGGKFQTSATFIIFNGALTGYHNEPVTYASGFANYIVKHKLGVITQSHILPNKVYSDGHKVCVWVWSPDDDALTKWWKAKSK